jgi:hypothetical protein
MATKRKTDNPLGVSTGPAAVPARRTAAKPRTRRVAASETAAAVEPAAIVETPASLEAAPAPTVAQPSHEEIASLAYSFWLARGCQGGSPHEDWVRAEEQLRLEFSR